MNRINNSAAEKFLSTKLPKDEGNAKANSETKEKLIQRGYYLTEEQDMNIKMYAIKNKKDASSVIREIIDKFFSSEK